MTLDPALIDRIVTNVLEQIRTPPGPRAVTPTSALPVTPTPPTKPATSASAAMPSAEYGVTDNIVTAAVLEQLRFPSGSALVVGPKSILTPSAHDWLRQRKVSWKRGRTEVAASATSATGAWRLLAATVTPTVRSLLDHVSRAHPGWRRELTGKPQETVDVATRLITTAEAQRLLIITQSAELVAGLANRGDKVRAAVIASAERLRHVMTEWNCNVVVVSPEGRSLMELRAIVQTCANWN